MKTTPVAPIFNPSAAKPCKPARHEPTGRTYAFIQGDALFSATGVFVAIASTSAKSN